MDIIGSSIKGVYRDILKGSNHKNIYDSGWISNRIVDRCRMLLSAFMKNDQPKGIRYLALGKGLEEWDTKGIEPPASSITHLMDPSPYKIQVEELNVVYLNEYDEEIDEPTNRVQITGILGPNKPPVESSPSSSYPLREFALFGQFLKGPNDQYEDYMINCIRHSVIYKDASATLSRVIRLYF